MNGLPPTPDKPHTGRFLVMKPEQTEIDRLRKEIAKLKMESFFSSLKTERTSRKVYRSRASARSDVFDYIERFYNSTRRNSTLGYVSPVAFEQALRA